MINAIEIFEAYIYTRSFFKEGCLQKHIMEKKMRKSQILTWMEMSEEVKNFPGSPKEYYPLEDGMVKKTSPYTKEEEHVLMTKHAIAFLNKFDSPDHHIFMTVFQLRERMCKITGLLVTNKAMEEALTESGLTALQ